MENTDFIKDMWQSFTYTAGADINAGEIALVEDTYILSFLTLKATQLGEGVYWSNMVEIPKEAGETFANGKFLWLDPASSPLRVFNADGGGFLKVGIAKFPAAAADTHVTGSWSGYGI